MTRASIASPSARPISSVNKFSGLEKPQAYDLSALNQWAHQVRVVQQIGRKAKSKPVDKKLDDAVNYISGSKKPDAPPSTTVLQARSALGDSVVVLKSDKDVDGHSDLMAALPSDKKGMSKVMKKIGHIKLEHDERLCMVDSGSYCHAIDADVELPEHTVEPLKDKELGKDAESACGGIMKRFGKVRTEGSVDGMPLNIRWNAMKVKVPILSVRRLVHDNHDVTIGRNGGFLRNLRNGNQIPFFEHQGVYYLKMKIHRPDDAQENESLFSRRAA